MEDRDEGLLLPQRFIRFCKKKKFQFKAGDLTGSELTGGTLLMRTLILRRLLLRNILQPDERYVGILLPPAVGGVVVNAAVTLTSKISANLNYTVSQKVMNACIEQAKIRHVLTTRKVMEKLNFKLDAEVVYLEDLREKITLGDKLSSALASYVLPAGMVERSIGVDKIKPDDVMTVIFTSGSTGEPKGVLLTHRNIVSNVDAVDKIVHLKSTDVVAGILPFFHSFGYTIPLWTVLGQDIAGAYHFTPLEPRQISKLVEKFKATIILATPTFLRSYVRRCEPEEFKTLEVVVVGAEKMPTELADSFEKRFNVRPVEGYGATELSPLVSCNIPPSRSRTGGNDLHEGSVGQPIPRVTTKIVDPETFAPLPQGEPGMLLISGPNVMKGYLDQPEKTAAVMRDGYYITGDIAKLDDRGFIIITGRQSRFSKIGGEMAPHVRIEEELLKCYDTEELETIPLAVSAAPDQRKGERLVVLYTKLPMEIDAMCARLSQAGLPNLWIPDHDSFYQIDTIPVLGTGKLDLRKLKELALEKAKDD